MSNRALLKFTLSRWMTTALFVSALSSSPASADSTVVVGNLELSNAWSDYRVGAGGTAKLYFTLTNSGTSADRLVGVHSKVARGPHRLNRLTITQGQRHVVSLPTIEIPAESGLLEFSEAGYFVELVDLQQTLTMGSQFKVVLAFEHHGAVELTVTNRFHAPELGERITRALGQP